MGIFTTLYDSFLDSPKIREKRIQARFVQNFVDDSQKELKKSPDNFPTFIVEYMDGINCDNEQKNLIDKLVLDAMKTYKKDKAKDVLQYLGKLLYLLTLKTTRNL